MSKKFTKAEKAWTAAEKELFGLVYAIRILSKKTKLLTDLRIC